jgi:electron transfer flavoprotein beta subunit
MQEKLKTQQRTIKMLKIAVCIKQVPDSGTVSLDPVTHTLARKCAGAILNPLDEFPLEMALRLKDKTGAHVTAFTMGPPRAEEILARAIAMGADKGVLLTDKAFAGSDTWSTSLILTEAIRKHGPFDIVLCGKQAIDGDTAQVGPEIAGHLGWSQAASVSHIEMPESEAPASLTLRRLFEHGTDTISIKLPAVLMVLKEACEPRVGTLGGRIKYFEEGVSKTTASDLSAAPERFGLKGSPTRVVKTSVPDMKRNLSMLQGSVEEKTEKLYSILREKL